MTVSPAAALPPLTRLLARGGDPATVVAALQHSAIALTSTDIAVLLRPGAAGQWNTWSATGMAHDASGPWLVSQAARSAADRALAADRPVALSRLDRDAPELAGRLGTSACVIVPVGGPGTPLGLLLLGGPSDRPVDPEVATMLGDAMAVALGRVQVATELAHHRDVAALMRAFARGGATPLTLVPALEAVCRGLSRLFHAGLVEVWHHDRRARQLVCAATSAAGGRPQAPIATADPGAMLAGALGGERAALVRDAAAGATLVVPLRGRRRLLGVLAARGVHPPPAEGALLDRADEVGRQLSAILENMQLLDDVLRSRGELAHVFDSLTDLVAVVDGDGRIVEVNRAFASRLGVTRQALVDQPVASVVSAPLSAWLARAAARIGQSGQSERTEVADTGMGGEFDVALTPLGGPGGRGAGLVLVARDVSVETRLEAERERLATRLDRSEKLLALAQFVAGVAHELNNPLQGVLGHLELVRRDPGLPGPVRRDLALIHREADRAARIVRNLLLFAGSGRLQRRALDINTVASRVLKLRARAMEAGGIEVTRDLAAGLPRIKGDALLLQQALLNLVINAEQAMAGGGRLAVRTAPAGPGRIELSVEDSGPGLAPDVRSRLFEPFFTTKDVGHGTGLGLAITFGIVQAHGATIEAGNHAGGGARFAITFEQ